MEKDFYKTYFQLERDHWWFRVRRNVVLWLIKKYKTPKTAKIFDFGCGSGYLVGYLQKMGYDVSGTDISAEAIEFGLSRGIRKLSVAENGEIAHSDEGFDLVLALDVIEHIKDDLEAFRCLEKSLKPGGMLIVTVPAYQWMWGVQDIVAHHFRRYTISSLADIVKKTGQFKIIKKTYFNTFLFLPILIVRFLSKWFNLKGRESDFDINNRFLNGLFYFIFNLETIFLKMFGFPFGISILLVLKKND